MVARQADITDRQVRYALSRGQAGRHDPERLAAACDGLIRRTVQKSTARAIDLARQFVRLARRESDMAEHLAHRALGWANHVAGNYAAAEQAYLKGRECARTLPDIRARIDRILVDVYMYRGDLAAARRYGRSAIQTFKRLGMTADAAKTRINLGNLYHRQDRHKQARREYREAYEYFIAHEGDDLILGLCEYNLANTEAQLLQFDDADSLYTSAQHRFESLNYTVYATECEYGSAWLCLLRGEYHESLQRLAECRQQFEKAQQKKGVMLCYLDEAEASLELNLLSDALNCAREAEQRAAKLGLTYEKAKASLFRARASSLLGDDADASRSLARARSGFEQVGNEGFLAVSKLFEASWTAQLTPPAIRSVRRRFKKAQLPLWEAVCDLHLYAIRREPAVARRLEKNVAVHTVPHLHIRWQTLLGREALRTGQPEEAIEHWSAAARLLQSIRTSLPPVELRELFMRGHDEPFHRIIDQLMNDDPAAAAAWVEQYRTAGVWAIKHDDAGNDDAIAGQLDDLAAKMRLITSRIDMGEGKRSTSVSVTGASATAVQRELRTTLARKTGRGTRISRADKDIAYLHAEADAATCVIQWYVRNDNILALLHQAGRTRRVWIPSVGSDLEADLSLWQIILNRRLLELHQFSDEDRQEEQALFERLAARLWEPLDLGGEVTSVVIITDGILSMVPWTALRRNGRWLLESHSISVAPSVRHYVMATERPCNGGPRLLLMGDTSGIQSADTELRAVANGNNLRVVESCGRRDVPDSGAWSLWHFIGHAGWRSDNPFYSYLSMTDGPLFAIDLRLRSCQVDLVVLSACHTGQQSIYPGEEASGLVRALLEMGARSVVGSLWAVDDEATSHWMKTFYEYIHAGCGPADATRKASLTILNNNRSVYEWASFSVFGAR